VLRNRYVFFAVAFVIWILFLDTNSVLIQWELKQELKQLEADKQFFQKEIEANKAALEALTGSDENLEKYARENHLMVREGEEVFIVAEE
jgi:cell division protein FtsB